MRICRDCILPRVLAISMSRPRQGPQVCEGGRRGEGGQAGVVDCTEPGGGDGAVRFGFNLIYAL